MEPNGPFPMQYYDQGHGNSNGFPPNFSQSPSISSPNNSMTNQAAPYAYRPMENGISRYMNESFDGQNFGQHPSQFYQQSGINPRRNDSNFPMKTQQMGAQGFPNPQMQGFGTSRDNFSSGNFNSFMPGNMNERIQQEGDMFTSSAQNFPQVRQNPINSLSRVSFEQHVRIEHELQPLSRQSACLAPCPYIYLCVRLKISRNCSIDFLLNTRKYNSNSSDKLFFEFLLMIKPQKCRVSTHFAIWRATLNNKEKVLKMAKAKR